MSKVRARGVRSVGKILSIVAFVLNLVPLTMAASFELESLVWKKRVVLVFAPGSANRALLEQRRILDSAECGVAERDIVTVYVIGDADAAVDGRLVGEETNVALRRRFGTEPDRFQVLLIGKDGSVKMRSEKPITARDLFTRIDSMPMRRSEMLRNESGEPCRPAKEAP